jgi:hypothetical protein
MFSSFNSVTPKLLGSFLGYIIINFSIWVLNVMSRECDERKHPFYSVYIVYTEILPDK